MGDDSAEIRVNFSVTDVCGDSSNDLDSACLLADDVKLRVGDNGFYANKGLRFRSTRHHCEYAVEYLSSVFRDMFVLSEASQGKKEMEEIELKGVDASEFKNFIGAIHPLATLLPSVSHRGPLRREAVADCEYHLFGPMNVPWFGKLKLAVDLNRRHLKIKTVNQK
ncbi:hypothetical protein AAVH_27132 [Aphelenchoides avenae]|nr:hypothetical protein AAVH_27132 [Aphelenchus avenae]